MTDRRPKQRKTPAQRAQEALDIEERRVKKLTDQWTTSKADTDRLSKERDAAVVRRDYLRQHPDLPKQKQPITAISSTSTGAPA